MEVEEPAKDFTQLSGVQLFQAKVEEMRRLFKQKNRQQQIPSKYMNRRYRKLQQLIDKEEFFSEDEIKMREYSKTMPENLSELPFSSFLEEIMMKEEYRQLLEDQYNLSREQLPKHAKYDEAISKEEMEDNQDELIRFMHTKFLLGEEIKSFNYEDIDNDSDLDDRKIVDQDEEDKYFDDEEEEIQLDPTQSEYTGIEDY